jgi:hypothetical protein
MSSPVEAVAKYPELALIPLREAYLCAECDVIGNDATYCWACGCTSLLTLAAVLKEKGNV